MMLMLSEMELHDSREVAALLDVFLLNEADAFWNGTAREVAVSLNVFLAESFLLLRRSRADTSPGNSTVPNPLLQSRKLRNSRPMATVA